MFCASVFAGLSIGTEYGLWSLQIATRVNYIERKISNFIVLWHEMKGRKESEMRKNVISSLLALIYLKPIKSNSSKCYEWIFLLSTNGKPILRLAKLSAFIFGLVKRYAKPNNWQFFHSNWKPIFKINKRREWVSERGTGEARGD